jgi:hypothetical protein
MIDKDFTADDIANWLNYGYDLHDRVWKFEDIGGWIGDADEDGTRKWSDIDFREKYGDDIDDIKEGITIEICEIIAEIIAGNLKLFNQIEIPAGKMINKDFFADDIALWFSYGYLLHDRVWEFRDIGDWIGDIDEEESRMWSDIDFELKYGDGRRVDIAPVKKGITLEIAKIIDSKLKMFKQI